MVTRRVGTQCPRGAPLVNFGCAIENAIGIDCWQHGIDRVWYYVCRTNSYIHNPDLTNC